MEKDTKQNKNIASVLAVLILIIVVFIAGTQYSSNANVLGHAPSAQAPGGNSSDRQAPHDSIGVFTVRDTDVPRGESTILLIEYSDYECPFCQRFHKVAQALTDSGEVQWVYRHLPLPNHASADEGAVIAECVRIHKGGAAFLTYTDAVFEVSGGPSLATYKLLAKNANLSKQQIDGCLKVGSNAQALVEQHKQEAQLFGINGTPGSFLVNTKTGALERIPGALPIEAVREIISSIQ